MNNSYYCIECGKKTLKNTGVDDYEAGERFICESCGIGVWMSYAGGRDFTVPELGDYVRPPFKFSHSIDYGDIAKRNNAFLLAEMEEMSVEELSIFGEVLNNIHAKGETVTIRRQQLFKDANEQN